MPTEIQLVETGTYPDHAKASDIDAQRGTLTPIGRFETEKTPRGFAIDPRGKFLLSVGLDSAGMTVHAIDPASGALTSAGRHPMGTQPNWVEIVDLR